MIYRNTRKISRNIRKKSAGQKNDYSDRKICLKKTKSPKCVWLCDKRACIWTGMLCLLFNVLWLWYYILYSLIKFLGASIFVLEFWFQLMGHMCIVGILKQCNVTIHHNLIDKDPQVVTRRLYTQLMHFKSNIHTCTIKGAFSQKNNIHPQALCFLKNNHTVHAYQ